MSVEDALKTQIQYLKEQIIIDYFLFKYIPLIILHTIHKIFVVT